MSLSDVVCSRFHPPKLLSDATNGKTEVHCENRNDSCCFGGIKTLLASALNNREGEISVSI